MNKKEIIEQAFMYLKNELGQAINWEKATNKKDNLECDAIFMLNDKRFCIVAKNEVRNNQMYQFDDLKKLLGDLVIVANYFTPTAKNLLKERGINCIDRTGNIYFKFQQVYIHIEGIPNQAPTEDNKNRAFTKAGIKVVFQFLLNPELINATYREMCEKADVALGTIPKVIEGLKNERFLLKKDETHYLINNYKELLQRWQQEYTRRLKPTLYIKRYRPLDKEFRFNWKNIPLVNNDIWGGEPAAYLLTKYLQPEIFTLYTQQPQQNIIKIYHWVPDEFGEIHVYRKFWKYPLNNKPENPTLLIYADLMETGDDRCIETANMIYEQHLQKY